MWGRSLYALLTSITVNSQNSVFSSVDGVVLNKSRTELFLCPGGKSGSYTIPNNVAMIFIEAFYYCISLTNVTIPASVTNIFFNAFTSCSNMTGIYFKGNTPKTSFDMPFSLVMII